MDKTKTEAEKKSVKLATFYVGDALCGMDILQIQEINKLMTMTKVPQGPEYVLGILNLRGQIVTVIDLGKKLGMGETEPSLEARNVIVNSTGSSVGLLVKKIGDVVAVDLINKEPSPANMSGIQGKYFIGSYKRDNALIGILDISRVLGMEE